MASSCLGLNVLKMDYPELMWCSNFNDDSLVNCILRNTIHKVVNSSLPEQNGHHFADYIIKRIFLNENGWILIVISLKSIPKGPVDNK